MMDAAGGPYQTCVSTFRIPRSSSSDFRVDRYCSASATTSICARIGSVPGSACASAARSSTTTPSSATSPKASASADSASFEPSSGTRILPVFMVASLWTPNCNGGASQNARRNQHLRRSTGQDVRRRLPAGSGPPRCRRVLSANVVLVDQAMKRLAVDAGRLRGGRHVAVVAREKVTEVRDLQDLQPLILGLPER